MRADDDIVTYEERRGEIVRKCPLIEMLSGPRQWHARERAYLTLVGCGTIRHRRPQRITIFALWRWQSPGRNYSFLPSGTCISNAYRIGPCIDLACRFMNILSRGWPRSSPRRGSDLTSRIGTLKPVHLAPLHFTSAFLSAAAEHVVTYRLHHLPRSSSFIHSRPSPPLLSAPALSLPSTSTSFILFPRARIFTVSFSLFSASTLYLRECHRCAVRRSPVPKRGGTICSVICEFTYCCRNRTV